MMGRRQESGRRWRTGQDSSKRSRRSRVAIAMAIAAAVIVAGCGTAKAEKSAPSGATSATQSELSDGSSAGAPATSPTKTANSVPASPTTPAKSVPVSPTKSAKSVLAPRTTPAPAPEPTIATIPSDGATDVDPTSTVSVVADNGTLDLVTLTNLEGRRIKGTLSSDTRAWTTNEVLGYGKTYTWSGKATNATGQSIAVDGRFTTVTPVHDMRAAFDRISDGATVGVGAPISLQFFGKVTRKAAVEERLKVATKPATTGSWAWLPDNEIGSVAHWRPRTYWKANTSVFVKANLYGVRYDDAGSWGRQDVTLRFKVGRAQISYGNVQTKRLIVKRNGSQLWNWPTSFGLESDPNRITPVGTYITMEKYAVTKFSNPRFGYTNLPIKWATRISNNGIFIHGFDKTRAEQGVSNVTHGCLNLTTARAKQYYDSALFGDPVQIVDPGKPAPTLGPDDGDVYDWTVPWTQWQDMSALH